MLIHGFTCAIDWWDRMMPLLERRHRVVAVDLLGHGGSEKPSSGYSMENQAKLVAAGAAEAWRAQKRPWSDTRWEPSSAPP